MAIISDGEWNRYGHPWQAVLDRLKAANVKVYRTDLQGEITITTSGKPKGDKLYEIKAAKEAKSDIWIGREAQKDDASRSGFIEYGDFGPPPNKTEIAGQQAFRLVFACVARLGTNEGRNANLKSLYSEHLSPIVMQLL